jgi:pilus assembly protein CpaC
VVPGRVTNRVNTTVELEAGQTFVIGGLIQNQITATILKVPVLGDLPFLGAAFSSKSYQETEQEVLVLVTPWLVDAMACDQRPQVLPGQETRRPDDFELFLENLIEVPRGPRDVCQNHRYVAAYKNSPSSAMFPCAGAGKGGCGPKGCGPAVPAAQVAPGVGYPFASGAAGGPGYSGGAVGSAFPDGVGVTDGVGVPAGQPIGPGTVPAGETIPNLAPAPGPAAKR